MQHFAVACMDAGNRKLLHTWQLHRYIYMYLYTSIAPLWGHVCVLDYLSIYYAQKVCCATISQLSLPTICGINLLYPHPDIVQCSLGISGSVRAAKLARHSHDKRMYICIYIYIYTEIWASGGCGFVNGFMQP